MATLDYEAGVEALSKLDPRRVVFFIGAGFTRDLGYPTWQELVSQLAAVVASADANLAAVMRKRIERGDLIHAADPFFDPEITANSRASTLKQIFETAPELKRRHRLLGALPCLALVTTNYDTTLERASTEHSQTAQVFRGPERFREFNSNINLRADAMNAEQVWAKPVLKIHNDTANCETIVLHSRAFDEVRRVPGFLEFYRNSLRSHHVVFIGFGGDDPNLVGSVVDGMENFAGFGTADCYVISATGAANPLAKLGASNIHLVQYDPRDNHQRLEDLLKDLNDAWISKPPSDAALPSVFEILVPAIQDGADSRILDLVGRRMVAEASRKAGDVSENSIVNQLSQIFRVDPTRARELARKYPRDSDSPAIQVAVNGPAQILAQGIRTRCISFDPHFSLTEQELTPIIRSTIEKALVSQGCATALALLRADSPSDLSLSQAVRRALRTHPPLGLGDADIETVEPCLADLFLHPTDAESSVLSRLAITSTAFGLIQALPSLETSSSLIPKRIYVDTNVAMPIIAQTQPRLSVYRSLISLAKQAQTRLCFLGSFVNEIDHHFKNAQAMIRGMGMHRVADVRAWAAQGLPEFRNVFLLGLAQSAAPDSAGTTEAMRAAYVSGDSVDFVGSLQRIGIDIEPISTRLPDDLASIESTILRNKESEHVGDARRILAHNEALQLVRLREDDAKGETSWFVTGDVRFRNVVRTFALPGSEHVLPVAPAMALIESLTTGQALSPGFARSLWSPNHNDAIDDALSKEIRRLTANVDFSKPQPIADARRRAQEQYLVRARSSAAGDTRLDMTEIVRESVFLALGSEIKRTSGAKD